MVSPDSGTCRRNPTYGVPGIPESISLLDEAVVLVEGIW
jgi:hypothetical protein